jgi:hypothetical protein
MGDRAECLRRMAIQNEEMEGLKRHVHLLEEKLTQQGGKGKGGEGDA